MYKKRKLVKNFEKEKEENKDNLFKEYYAAGNKNSSEKTPINSSSHS